ncbi:MAG: hypothetical protein LBS88_03760 [Tannerellaceae bacterium]|jgi:hypothetical protein|nr:hypothetical protein [Tannerellaceae bacterium]
MNTYEKGTFGYDLQYLSARGSMIVLQSDDAQAQLIVSPGYQGKVFTSTAQGPEGRSLGFVNYKVFESGELNEHMNGYGGENRLWIGPEGGCFSIFFKPGVTQVYDHWFTPPPFDTEPWQVLDSAGKEVRMEKEMQVSNYLGSRLHLNVQRRVSLLEATGIQTALGIIPGEKVKTVAYATENSLTNLNDYAWTAETGTVCIWMLDMFRPAPRALTIVPFIRGDEKELGVVATTAYFGEIPAGRYREKDGCVFLKTDGKYRSKIGLNSKRTQAIAGNYDPDSQHLIVTTFDVDREAVYLNQEWNPEKDPLRGDVFNAYNDGPLDDGSIMGPFLELESGSPAALIAPGESLIHNHHVFHFVGEEAALSAITETLFGIPAKELALFLPHA